MPLSKAPPGRNGWYLSELQLREGYEPHGLVRRPHPSADWPVGAVKHLVELGARIHKGNLTDGDGLRAAVEATRPDEVFNLAAESDVATSFERLRSTFDVNCVGVLRVLEVLREYRSGTGADVQFFQAGSAANFGSASPPQNDASAFTPHTPYAAVKAMAHHDLKLASLQNTLQDARQSGPSDCAQGTGS